MRIRWMVLHLVASVLLISLAAAAQQQAKVTSRATMGIYDRSREVSLQGTIVSVDAQPATAPFGPHAVLQTASGTVNVNLGNARLLQASGLDLKTGDAIRIVGVTVTQPDGTHLLARIVQKGNLAIAVRSPRGIVLKPGRPSSSADAAKAAHAGVL